MVNISVNSMTTNLYSNTVVIVNSVTSPVVGTVPSLVHKKLVIGELGY